MGKTDVLLVSGHFQISFVYTPNDVSTWDSYYRYSRRAKEMLARYDLVPQPKIIEVDLRGA
jgi:hypothetical protein